MALFAISDLHLSLGGSKPMDIFQGWDNHTERLLHNWNKLVSNEDTVIVPGDISWGIDFKEAFEDFKFINNLNGKKILLKGNHDYWWSTMTKMNGWLLENGFDTISILNNNCFEAEGVAICGSRGWVIEEVQQNDKKIMARECQRLELSLKDAKNKGYEKLFVFLHYPPIFNHVKSVEIIDVMKRYGVEKCFFGHLHGYSFNCAVTGEVDGINYKLISADFLKFSPYRVL